MGWPAQQTEWKDNEQPIACPRAKKWEPEPNKYAKSRVCQVPGAVRPEAFPSPAVVHAPMLKQIQKRLGQGEKIDPLDAVMHGGIKENIKPAKMQGQKHKNDPADRQNWD